MDFMLWMTLGAIIIAALAVIVGSALRISGDISREEEWERDRRRAEARNGRTGGANREDP